MTLELVETYLSAIAADHVHMIDHRYPYDVVRDLGRAAVAHLDGEVPERDGRGDLTVTVSSLCMDDGMWDTVLEAADAIRGQHALFLGAGAAEDARSHPGARPALDEDRLARLALRIRHAAYAWLIASDLADDEGGASDILGQASVAAEVAVGRAPRGQQSAEILHQADQVDALFGEFFDLLERAASKGLQAGESP